ncbi:MAG: spermidine/putrescine ABC transporter permease PotC, partial [Eubacteriaceae bacterium]|nr:spermidine/putrescine ABC transporter permease PotC [Eubacteriaceae bacterium]
MKMRQAGKRKLFGGLLASYAALVYVFLYIPVAAMIAFSFNDSTNNTIWRGFTTKWYALLMSDAEIWGILGTTVAIGAISTLLSVVVGTLGAVGMSRASFAGKGLVSSVLYVPIIIPEIVLAVATL